MIVPSNCEIRLYLRTIADLHKCRTHVCDLKCVCTHIYDDDAVDDDDDVDVDAVLPFYNGIANNIHIYYAQCVRACRCVCV